MNLCFSIPCTYQEGLLEIKSLKLTGIGESLEEAYLLSIKETKGLYTPLSLGKVSPYTDYKNINRYHLIVPFHEGILKAILDQEPVNEEKLKLKKKAAGASYLIEATPEEVLKHGY